MQLVAKVIIATLKINAKFVLMVGKHEKENELYRYTHILLLSPLIISSTYSKPEVNCTVHCNFIADKARFLMQIDMCFFTKICNNVTRMVFHYLPHSSLNESPKKREIGVFVSSIKFSLLKTNRIF